MRVCIPNGFPGRVHCAQTLLRERDGVSLFNPSLFFRTVPVTPRISLNLKGLPAKRLASGPPYHWRSSPCPPILPLARAGFFTRGNIHDRPAKPSIRCLRGNSGAARRLAPRVGYTHSPASASLVPCAARSAFHRGRFSGRTLPRPLGKMAQSSSGASRVIGSAIAVSCVRIQTCCNQR